MCGQNRLSGLRLLSAMSLLAAASFPALAGDVTLAWDPNQEADLAGYKIFCGTASGTYGAPIIIGKQTTYTITGLSPGTYYFAIKAYNDSGAESGFSNEVYTSIDDASGCACDLNSDSVVNVLDLQTMINSILGIIGNYGRDLNGDGKIDVLDLQVLGNVILGLRSCPL